MLLPRSEHALLGMSECRLSNLGSCDCVLVVSGVMWVAVVVCLDGIWCDVNSCDCVGGCQV